MPTEHQAVSSKKLFVTNRSSFLLSNMQTGGMLASDQTFLTYAVRHEVQFFGVGAVSSVDAAFDTPAGVFVAFLNNSTFQYNVGEKTEFEGPLAMTPAGGGPWGFVSDSTQPIINNGTPEARSIYVFPLPVAIVKRQGFNMTINIYDLTSGGTGGGAAVTVTQLVNEFTGMRLCRSYIDGYHTRDVL